MDFRPIYTTPVSYATKHLRCSQLSQYRGGGDGWPFPSIFVERYKTFKKDVASLEEGLTHEKPAGLPRSSSLVLTGELVLTLSRTVSVFSY
jgi:hypothetical protein